MRCFVCANPTTDEESRSTRERRDDLSMRDAEAFAAVLNRLYTHQAPDQFDPDGYARVCQSCYQRIRREIA